MNNIAAIILAAGKGKRMNSKTVNKVVLPLGQKPMILHTFGILEKLEIKTIIVVVGFAKDSVMALFKDKNVIFAQQKKRLGTAHAVSCAMKKMPLKME
ncbi:MAG: NTP transferase domain-containing protein, partial [Patescibacteria group bacterium]